MPQVRLPRYESEYRVRMPDGSWCWLHARGRCLRNTAGKPYRFVGSAIDVSAQRQAQLRQCTGLGLSLVHGIVADLGGAIDVKTQAGEGTTFEI